MRIVQRGMRLVKKPNVSNPKKGIPIKAQTPAIIAKSFENIPVSLVNTKKIITLKNAAATLIQTVVEEIRSTRSTKIAKGIFQESAKKLKSPDKFTIKNRVTTIRKILIIRYNG